MLTISLEEFFKKATKQAPYTKSLRVTVITVDTVRCFKNEKGEERRLLNAAVADATMAGKVVIYDPKKFHRFIENKSVIIRNCIRKPDTIVVTAATAVFPTAEMDPIPQEIIQAAIYIIRPPPAELKPLKEALQSPVKTKVSVEGRIVQEEAAYAVNVKNDTVNVKAIYLCDTSHPKCKVSLWRDAVEVDVRPGDFVRITNVVTNSFKNETSLSTTSLTTIQKTDAPEENIVYSIVGCCVEDVTVTFLMEDDNTFQVPLEVVKAAFPESEDLESHITSLCIPSLEIKCHSKGAQILEVEMM